MIYDADIAFNTKSESLDDFRRIWMDLDRFRRIWTKINISMCYDGIVDRKQRRRRPESAALSTESEQK